MLVMPSISYAGRRAVGPPPQPSFSNVKLLMGFEGADGSTTFTDESSIGHSLTRSGNAQIDTAQFKYGASSGLFDGTGDFLTVNSSGSDVSVSFGNICIEAWIRLSATGKINTILDKSSGGHEYRFSVQSTNLLQLATFKTGALAGVANGATPLTTGVWYHVAGSRAHSGGILRVFVNGQLDGQANETQVPSSNGAQNALVGRMSGFTDRDFQGWMDELRFCAETLYTSSFTPPPSAHPRS